MTHRHARSETRSRKLEKTREGLARAVRAHCSSSHAFCCSKGVTMPCLECAVDHAPPKDPPCKLCLQEASSCCDNVYMIFDEHHKPCGPDRCRLSSHYCRFQVGPKQWNTCGKHRDLPLDAGKDHYVCSEHLGEQLRLEEQYPSVVMSKCAAPGCWGSRCLPVPGKNGLRYCRGHIQDRRRSQSPTGWRRPRPQLIQALREAGLQGLPWNTQTALEYPAVAACYKTEGGLMDASLKMLLVDSKWFSRTRQNYWSLEGERRCTHAGPGGRCARPSEGAPLCALHTLHSQAGRLVATLLLCLRRASEGGPPGRDRDFYGLLRSQKLSEQRAFLVSCLWA